MIDEDLYDGREQTLAKHNILKNYLLRLALIVGRWSKTVNYIDCFSGPWNVRGENYEDSSFAIAIGELRKARERLSEDSIALKLRCFFLEANPDAFSKLDAYAKTVSDLTIERKNKLLENAIDDILKFNRDAGTAFPFVFIDPTGWTGFHLKVITPLLQLKPGEVLINFMTWHARRFIEAPQERSNFDALYGDSEWRGALEGLSGDLRDDTMVRLYADRIKKAGGYEHVCYTPILHREENTTHFHLIYASRSDTGLEVFKDAERSTSKVMEEKRANVQQAKRSIGGQQIMFGAEEMHDQSYYSGLRAHYLSRAKIAIHELLWQKKTVAYDLTWRLALSFPLVWERDLKDWLNVWRKENRLSMPGLSDRQEPKRGTPINLIWK